MENERRAALVRNIAQTVQTFAEDGFFVLQLDVVMVAAVNSTVTNTAVEF